MWNAPVSIAAKAFLSCHVHIYQTSHNLWNECLQGEVARIFQTCVSIVDLKIISWSLTQSVQVKAKFFVPVPILR
jgi:hypothetical protein